MARITWNNPSTGEKAQFVADTFKESLFNYAFDSNKVPSLNLHYFCKDFQNTALRAEQGVIKDGNMLPLIEEFEYIIRESIWLPDGISTAVLCFRNKQGYPVDVSKDKNLDTSARAKYYQDSAAYIDGVLKSNNDYRTLLLKEIEKLLRSSTFSITEKRMLYFCLREFLSEIINIGVSKAHLYNQTQKVLFTARTPDDDIEFVMEFLRSILPNKNSYSVVFGVTDEVYAEMKDILAGIRIATEEESSKLASKYVAEIDIDALDPVSALLDAKGSFSAVLGIYNCCMHDTNIKTNPRGLVKKTDEAKFHTINDSANLLRKNKNKIKEERIRWLRVAITKQLTRNLLSSFELHNNALNRNEPQTQLLNLWTIIELLIETKQDQMTKVNYVSNVLCSILCNIYFERLIKTLYAQISLSPGVKTIIRTESKGDSDYKKLALILKGNSTLRTQLIAAVSDYPLEVYKIEMLSDVLSTPEKMKNYLIRHSNRLRWQIMRIYRNRCMIVHNGSHCDYIDSIVENLHYYVDELFDYIFLRMSEGVTDTKAIFAYSRVKEQEHMQILSDKKQTISDEDFLSIVFDY